MINHKSESIPGVDQIINSIEFVFYCIECNVSIKSVDFKTWARMCKKCFDADGEDV